MRIIVNQSTALGAKTGIGHYTRELLNALRSIAPDETFDTFPPAWWNACRGLGGYLRSGKKAGAKSTPSWRSSISDYLRSLGDGALRHYLGLANRWHKYDLYHEPNHIPLPSKLPTIATIHDLSVILHPEWHPADRVAYYERSFRKGLRQCVHLLANSEFTRQQVIRILDVAPDRITCTPLGIRPNLQPMAAADLAEARSRLGLPDKYLLFVGTMEPRKNLLMLMRAYCDLPADLRERCPLVLAGGWGWNAAEIAAFLDSEARHRNVIHLGYVQDADFPALYGGARALVFPSFYEGFGLPLLEMMACGGAVLASTADAVVEVVGRHA